VLERGEVGEIYNIGAGNEITNRELTYRLLELCGRDESFIEPVADRSRPRPALLDHPSTRSRPSGWRS
jgi:dTDP-D-glucose 4,6-dehydratase